MGSGLRPRIVDLAPQPSPLDTDDDQRESVSHAYCLPGDQVSALLACLHARVCRLGLDGRKHPWSAPCRPSCLLRAAAAADVDVRPEELPADLVLLGVQQDLGPPGSH